MHLSNVDLLQRDYVALYPRRLSSLTNVDFERELSRLPDIFLDRGGSFFVITACVWCFICIYTK
jgi:hypothetical protein